MVVARALENLLHPTKMNYEILGNTIPHLHVRLFPRFLGDPFEGGPINPVRVRFRRSPRQIDPIRRAIRGAAARRGSAQRPAGEAKQAGSPSFARASSFYGNITTPVRAASPTIDISFERLRNSSGVRQIGSKS